MSYHDLLMQYGSEADSAEQRIYIYAEAPKRLKTTREVSYRDKTAAADIMRLEKLIDDLKDYRQALAARYAQLETMTYRERLELERYPRICGGGISYYVRIVRTYEDDTSEKVLSETYSGKERRKAFDRFEELKKQRPGIEAIKDIERKSWER